MKILVLIDR